MRNQGHPSGPGKERRALSYSVEISRTYTYDQGKYHDARSYTETQLLRVSRLAERAYDRVRELDQEQQRKAA